MWRSATWPNKKTPALRPGKRWWWEEDSNLRNHKVSDLQSDAFDRSAIPPKARNNLPGKGRFVDDKMVPKVGLEPTRPHGHRILSPARLPVPPLRLTRNRTTVRSRFSSLWQSASLEIFTPPPPPDFHSAVRRQQRGMMTGRWAMTGRPCSGKPHNTRKAIPRNMKTAALTLPR